MDKKQLIYDYYIFDIDGTLTRFRNSYQIRYLHGNFLFPIFRDMMVERGDDPQAAEDAILTITDKVPFWDYFDFISAFHLPAKEAYERMWQWHVDHVEVYDETVAMVHELFDLGKKLFIVSNNPYSGCCMKLRCCGLADEFGSKYFRRIFGTDKLRGCKGVQGVWQRAIDQIPVDPKLICIVGDNLVEDGEIPLSCGVGHAIILEKRMIQHLR